MELDLEQTIEREWMLPPIDGNIEALPLTYYLLGRTFSLYGSWNQPPFMSLWAFFGHVHPLRHKKNDKYTERYTYLSPRVPLSSWSCLCPVLTPAA